MDVLTPIERENLQTFLFISELLIVLIYGNTAQIYNIDHFDPHACQQITVEQSYNSGDTVAKIWR